MSKIPTRIHRRLPRRLPPLERYSNYCLDLNGVTQTVECGAAAILDILGDLTLESWIKTTNGNGGFITKQNGANIVTYEMGIFTGALFYRQGTAASWVSYPALPINNGLWNCARVVRFGDGIALNSIIFYINGVRVLTTNLAVAPIANAFPVILALSQGLGYLDTFMDEVRILNVAQSDLQAKESFLRGYALREVGSVLNLRMEEGSGLTVYDTSDIAPPNNGSLLPALTPPIWTPVAKHELLAEAGV